MKYAQKIATGPNDYRGRLDDASFEINRAFSLIWAAELLLRECPEKLKPIVLHERVGFLSQFAMEVLQEVRDEIEGIHISSREQPAIQLAEDATGTQGENQGGEGARGLHA